MSDGFHEVRFPTDISLGAIGGPKRDTEVVELASGREQRNTRKKHSRRTYNAGYGMKKISDVYKVIAFFEERRGRLYGFRYKDPLDNSSVGPSELITSQDQLLGEGDGVQDEFQLIKQYGDGDNPYVRPIQKPVSGSLRVAIDGIEKFESTHFDSDFTTGVVTFAQSHIPQAGQLVTAGFSFDVPVRFDADDISVNLKAFHAGEIPSIPLVELRL